MRTRSVQMIFIEGSVRLPGVFAQMHVREISFRTEFTLVASLTKALWNVSVYMGQQSVLRVSSLSAQVTEVILYI